MTAEDRSGGSVESDVDETEVVQTAVDAAEDVIFSRYRRTELRDIDVTVTFEDGILDIDVYLDGPEETADPAQVAEDAALAARGAVDDLFSSQ